MFNCDAPIWKADKVSFLSPETYKKSHKMKPRPVNSFHIFCGFENKDSNYLSGSQNVALIQVNLISFKNVLHWLPPKSWIDILQCLGVRGRFSCSGAQIVILTMPFCSEVSSYSWKLLTDVWSDQNFCLKNFLKKFTSENRPFLDFFEPLTNARRISKKG